MEEKLNQILKNQVIIMRALGHLPIGVSATESLDTRMMESATLLSAEILEPDRPTYSEAMWALREMVGREVSHVDTFIAGLIKRHREEGE